MSPAELTSLAHWSIFLGSLDAQHRFFPVSSTWQQHLSLTVEQLYNTEFSQWIHPDDVTATQHALLQLHPGKPKIIFENRWLDGNHRYRWLLWNAQLSTEKIIYVAAIEITENKNLNNFYQAILEALRIGILLHETDGTVSNCNPYIEELLGVTADTLLGQKTWQFPTIYEDGATLAPEKLPAYLTLSSGETCYDVVMGVCKPAGELTWLSCSSQPLWLKDGVQPDAVVSSFIDITDYKLRINELRDKLTLLSCIFDDIDIGIAMTDALGRFVRVNAAYCKLYGYQLEELIGQSFTLLLPPAVRTQAMQHHTAFLAGHNDYPSFWILQHRDGKIIKQSAIENRIQCVDGRQFKITLVLPDNVVNSEQQQSLEATFNLIDSNLWMHKLLSQLPVTILCLDREGKIITAQGQQLALLGLTQNSLGKYALEIKMLAPFYDEIKRVLEGETISKVVGYKDVALETHYQPVMEGGKWIGTLMILHDITSQRLCQMRLKNIQHELALLMPQVNVGVIYTENEKIIRVNSICCELLGYNEAELLALSLTQLHPDFHTHIQLQTTVQHNKSQAPYQIEQMIRTKAGIEVACQLILKPLPPRRALWLLKKIEAIEAVNPIVGVPSSSLIPLYLQDIWNQLSDAVLLLDQDFCIQDANSAMERLSGYSIQELQHKSLSSLDKNEDNLIFYQELQQQLVQQRQVDTQIEQRHKQGAIYVCNLKVTVYRDNHDLHYLAVLQSRPEALLFDPLTDLPLRAIFDFNLQKNLARAQRHQKKFAVLLVRVENLAKVQQQFGYPIRDKWLQMLGNMLKTTVRDSDTVAWNGQQQFIVLLEEISQAKDAGLVGQMILFKLTQALKFGEQEVQGEINIGIAVYPEDHQEAEYLVQMAGIALERAEKQGSGGQCCFHNPKLQE
jgi:diguanylate cyclase (GGDEF)-like protein/PAS domain S-box-containing protein